ncbi:MAG: hypothetical protein ACR2GP_16775 [Burkholderiaceae bacterium]
MSSFNAYASAARVFKRARTTVAAACAIVLACFLATASAQARGIDAYGDGHFRMVQVRGPEDRANDRAMRQAARAQRQQQMQGERAVQREQMQRMPERELAAPQAPGFRPPEPSDAGQMGRPGRLTPDERRALRQQINQAGRDVYRPNSRP